MKHNEFMSLESVKQSANQTILIINRTHGQSQKMIEELKKGKSEVKIINLEDSKKVKALEIIKHEFEISFNDEEQKINLQSIDHPYSHIRFGLTRIIKDKKNYDLLKEVLS